MSGLDLDKLRGRWAEQSQQIEDSLVLDVAAVRAALTGHTVSAFRRHGRWLLAGFAGEVLALVLLAGFVVAHAGDVTWMLLGFSLMPLLVSGAVVDLRQWRALRRLDFDAPVLALRAELDALQAMRLRQVKAILACSVLLWMPFLVVLVKFLGGDLLRVLHPSVLWVNVAIGLVFIPLFYGIAGWIGRRYAGQRGLHRFQSDSAGDSWRKARDRLDARDDFEQQAEQDPAAALRERAWPPALLQDLRAMRRRLLLGILACATAMLAIGLFNMGHGGQVQFIVPGVLLNLAVVAQMAAAIQLRIVLVAGEGGVRALQERCAAMLALRRRFAMGGVVALPLVSVVLVQVLVRIIAGVDLATLAGRPATAVIVGAVIAACAVLWRKAHRERSNFLPTWVEAMSLGVLAPGQALLDDMVGTDVEREREP